ncbi:MAG: phospholipase D-like domain-containing protein [Beijerinckiaceae bacterium]|nr:phospholipase D-like domain-containing protein [Beijerinckiaceae bacterium]
MAGFIFAIVLINLNPDRRELTSPVQHMYGVADPQFIQTMNGLFGSNIVPGNQLRTLVNGDRIFPDMLAAISAAETTITFETFIYWRGEIANRFAQALSAKARSGVSVKVLLDWVGSIEMDTDLVRRMEEAGVEVFRFRPIRWYTLDRINNRTHRKILVVDGRVGFTGGVGIGDEWTGDARTPEEWRETHYRVEGPVVASLQAAFAENWVEATGELIRGEGYFPQLQEIGDKRAQVVMSSSGTRNSMQLMLMTALASAEHRIRIGMAYFVPDDLSKAQLLEARGRGVEIDVILPGRHADHRIVRKASRHFWGELLAAGVRIHEFEPTMYHPKVVIVDETWTTVGSTNFDERSFRLNDEANLNVTDRAFALEQIAIFDADLAKSRQVTFEEWRNRPLLDKARDRVWSWLRVQL